MSNLPLLLIPNLGAEEDGDWRVHQRQPAVATSAQLWQLLFAASSRCPNGDGTPSWPTSLGPPATAAAFPCLDAQGEAIAWLADASAHEAADEQGRTLTGAPAAVVRRVHDKAFALRSADTQGYTPRCLKGLAHVFDPTDLDAPETFAREVLARSAAWPAWTNGRFTLKPRLGSSGRGRVGGVAASTDPTVIAGAAKRLAKRGGAILEPWLDRNVDLSVQLHVAAAPDGGTAAITLLANLEQWTTASGGCRGHWGEMDSRGRVFSGHPHEEAMREAAVAVVSEAAADGYTGPCGVDGFAFQHPEAAEEVGREILRPIVELNARFTMGLVAAGIARRALARVRQTMGLEPGGRVAFLLAIAGPPGAPTWRDLAQRLPEPNLLIELSKSQTVDGPAIIFAPQLDDLRNPIAPR